MKKIIVATLTLFSVTAMAQKTIIVNIDTQAVDKNTQHTYLVDIPQTTQKEVTKNWIKYVGNGSKGKATELNGENRQIDAVNTNVSPYPFSVYSRQTATSEGVRLAVWVTQNGKPFISSDATGSQDLAVKKYIRDFAVEEYREIVKEELKAEQKKQKELESEIAGYIKHEEKSVKTINDNERSTQRADDAMVTNTNDIKSSTDKIEDQKGMVNQTAADRNANKGAKKTLNDLESDKKALQRKNDKQSKNSESRDKENREEERNIAVSKEKQDQKTAELEKQKEVVLAVQAKLAAIN